MSCCSEPPDTRMSRPVRVDCGHLKIAEDTNVHLRLERERHGARAPRQRCPHSSSLTLLMPLLPPFLRGHMRIASTSPRHNGVKRDALVRTLRVATRLRMVLSEVTSD